MTQQLCKRCGTVLAWDDGSGEHMLCDPVVAADFADRAKRDRQKRREAAGERAARQRVLERHKERGVQIIHDAAKRLRALSADDVRADFLAAGIPPSSNGGIWSAAVARGWVTPVDERKSGGRSAHGKKIATYASTCYHTDRAGVV